MTNENILKLAIEKAEKNGWEHKSITGDMKFSDLNGYWISVDRYYSFIFSHDFAQAFWGEEKAIIIGEESKDSGKKRITIPITIPAWQYHLRNMVIEEEPLKYIEQFLDKP